MISNGYRFHDPDLLAGMTHNDSVVCIEYLMHME